MLNIVYIGIGQCGNRFADCFAKCATDNKDSLKNGEAGIAAITINTASADMSMLANVKEENKIKITLPNHPEGAGRNPAIGQESMEANLPLIDSNIELARQKAKMEHVDLCFLWAGLGGGTGTGGLQALAEHLVGEGYRIAIGVTMPRPDEGMITRYNAYNAMLELQDWLISKGRRDIPYMVIDNNKISGLALEKSNEIIARNIARLNKATSCEVVDNTFDDSDFLSVLLHDGTMACVRARIPLTELTGDSTDVVLSAIKSELAGAPFTESVASKARGAAILTVVPRKFLETNGFNNRRLLDENIRVVKQQLPSSNPYSTIYIHPSESVTDRVYVYVLLTGLADPQKEMLALADEVSELIKENKAINKERRRSLKGLQKLSLDDDDDDDEEDENKEGYQPVAAVAGGFNFKD